MSAFLARRLGPARLLMIGAYRPADTITNGHPPPSFRHELQAHALCNEIRPELFNQEEVKTYLSQRLRKSSPTVLSTLVHHSTDGNPLFVRHFVEEPEHWVLTHPPQ